MNARQLAGELVDLCVDVSEAFFAHHAPDARLPRTFAGHAVGADVRADVIFTLGHLAAAGVESVAGHDVDELLTTLLAEVDGVATHSFFSYRIAETLLERGRFAGNPLFAILDAGARRQIAEACDSSSFVPLLDAGQLPRNYAAVLSRCEQARLALGLVDDRKSLDPLLDRLRALLASNPLHALDDSGDGSGRYDIYTADVWLFCEPLAAEIGPEWRAGLADALALVESVIGPDGTAIPWGRSTGALSVALTVELGATAIAHGIGDDASRWLRRAADAAATMRGCFGSDGVVNAHQHRDQDRYRGPARRLQLTFDLLGKLAWAARTLLALGPHEREVVSANRRDAYPDVDRLVVFDPQSPARLWAYRTRALSFALPFVGATRSHYLPALHRPGRFEVPVDQDLPTWTPLIVTGYQRYTSGGLPERVQHEPGRLDAHWDRFESTTDTFATERPAALAGSRTSQWRVEGRTVHLDDTLTFADTPQAVSFLVPEVAAAPLTVEFATDVPHAVSRIDVEGVAEWRSSWSQIRRVHQLDLDPAPELRYQVRVTPKLRVASTAHGHHYHRCLYEPLADRVVTRPSPLGTFADSSVPLDEIDVFHLHWPEWLAFDDLDEHDRIIATLRDRDIPVVWTAHNLTPHAKEPERFDPVYERWAHRADLVVHHSVAGERAMRDRYQFSSSTRHVVIAHGHFGPLWQPHLDRLDRASAERALGLEPCALRIGIVGAPRAEKRVVEFVRGFVETTRDDVQLAVWSLGFGELLPDDPRIVAAEPYRQVDAATYATRLAACDVLALPFDPDGEMLATGTVADALGAGIPVLASDWEFLVEYLGDARLTLGAATAADATAAVDTLTHDAVVAARAAMAARRSEYNWTALAEQTYSELDAVVAR